MDVDRTLNAAPAIESITETAIYGDDLGAAEEFYRDVLGLELLGKEPGRSVFFCVGPASVLLIFNPTETLQGDNLPPHGTTGPGHFAMGILPELFDAWRQRLLNKGVAIEKEKSWDRGGRSLYFRDPAGNVVELATPGIWGTPTGW